MIIFKKKTGPFITIFSFALLFLCRALTYAQGTSNEGTEFYAVFPTHVPSNNRLAAYSIFITGKEASSGTVTVGSFSQQFIVSANSVTEVNIPRADAYINLSESGSVLSGKAIHIVVDPGKPKVVVYGHIFAGARSAASLILPIEAMGQRYFSMNVNNYSPVPRDGGGNYIAVIATEANTKVFIRLNGNDIIPGGITLNRAGDTYQYLSGNDLTGYEIIADPVTSSCKRFAVFSGSTNVVISASGCSSQNYSSDPLYQQNYPIESWGNTYGFVPFFSASNLRARGSVFRVLAKDDGTRVSLNGILLATLNSGQYYTSTPSVNAGLITADKPIAVAQYSLTQDCAGGGFSDPDMVILNPVEYNIKNITVYSSSREQISEQYLNILIPTSAAASFRINGLVPSGSFTRLGTSSYSFTKLNLGRLSGNNFVLSANQGFNAIAYGFGDHESYAYSAGTNLASSQNLSAIKVTTQEELQNACVQEDFQFKLVLPEIAVKLTWQFGSDLPVVQDLPTARPITRNGKVFYEYFYPKTAVFNQAVSLPVKVLALYSSANSCYTSEQEINFIFEVYDPPQASFSAPPEACPNELLTFTDLSINNIKEITNWQWDFGDGTFSTLQNPTHSYSAGGRSYTVSLTVSNETGCLSGVYQQNISIRPSPVASFSFTGNGCDNNTIAFRDASTAGEGTIIKWEWNFGDGSSSSDQNPSHTFLKVGTYTVTLKITNSAGCSSSIISLPVNAYAPSLEVGTDQLILIGGEVRLKITTDGNGLRYKWSPSAGLNRDDIPNPLASPLLDTKYTLTITSAEGCERTDELAVRVIPDFVIPNTFTPNGDGINDTWNLKYLNTYPDVIVTVFNRNGEKMFVSVGYTSPWNGQTNGRDVPVGTYYYLIESKYKKRYAGYVTVLR